MRARARLVLSAATAAAVALAVPGQAAAPAPQVTDPAGDANLTNSEGNADNTVLPASAGNQAYADVLKVLWQVTKDKKKKVTGFTVTTTLAAAPTPPTGTTVVYRMLSTPSCGTFFGVVYYTAKSSDPSIPRSAVRDDCTGETRLTPIAEPKIVGSTMTWTVPLSAIPKNVKIVPGKKVTDLRFEVRELQDFQGQQVPAQAPVYGGAYGSANGVLDDGKSSAVFTFS